MKYTRYYGNMSVGCWQYIISG